MSPSLDVSEILLSMQESCDSHPPDVERCRREKGRNATNKVPSENIKGYHRLISGRIGSRI